jgi:hypothetical protein
MVAIRTLEGGAWGSGPPQTGGRSADGAESPSLKARFDAWYKATLDQRGTMTEAGMSTRRLALGLVAISMSAYGCGDGTGPGGGVEFEERDFVCAAGESAPCETTEPAHSVADRTAVAPDGEEQSFTYVVSRIELPLADDGLAAGFNLDNFDSGEGSNEPGATCEEIVEDFGSFTDDDHVGVDNALQNLIPTIESFLDAADCPGMQTAGCLNALLQQQLTEGGVILMMELTGVDDTEFDSSVEIQLVLGALPAGVTAPMVESNGTLSPGQTFDTAMVLGAAVPGDIFDGRVRAQAPELMLLVSTSDFDIPLLITEPEIRFDVDGDAAAEGAIGGFLLNDDIVEAASMIGGIGEDTVRPIIEGVADIMPMAAEPETCSALSVGIEFDAVAAVRNP